MLAVLARWLFYAKQQPFLARLVAQPRNDRQRLGVALFEVMRLQRQCQSKIGQPQHLLVSVAETGVSPEGIECTRAIASYIFGNELWIVQP